MPLCADQLLYPHHTNYNRTIGYVIVATQLMQLIKHSIRNYVLQETYKGIIKIQYFA